MNVDAHIRMLIMEMWSVSGCQQIGTTWCGCYFIFLMAGTLIVYHWPMRPIKVKL